MIVLYALTLAAFLFGAAVGAFLGFGAGVRERTADVAPEPYVPQPPRSQRAEWAADFARVRTEVEAERARELRPYRSRHAWVRAHNVAIGRPPARYTLQPQGVAAA